MQGLLGTYSAAGHQGTKGADFGGPTAAPNRSADMAMATTAKREVDPLCYAVVRRVQAVRRQWH
eukprot:8946475-Alexandrium_andersonii.AAC.1